MAKLHIVKEHESDSDVLRRKCREVDIITPRITRLLDDMIETLHGVGGVGLAAPQVGVSRRVVIVEVDEGDIIEMINPEITERKGKQQELEGCLSVPGQWGITDRPMKVTVKAMNRHGEYFTVSGEGLKARAFCHEIDHLDGVLYTDNVIRMVSEDELEG